MILRIFYKWLRKDGYPEEVSWIKVRGSRNHKLPEEILTQEEVQKLIDLADHIRDKGIYC